MNNAAFLVIAHRGASAYAPENTLAAFDLALSTGVRQAELDVQVTRDGHLVVIHDETVNRTSNGCGPVVSHTLVELRELDAGAWFGDPFRGERIPSFEEVLARYKGRLHIHAELKSHAMFLARRTADLVRQYDMTDQVTITSFQNIHLQEIRAYAPELCAGWLVTAVNNKIMIEAHALNLTQLCPKADTLTPELVRRLHDEGFIVRAWGVENEEQMRQVVQSGADGMTVDFPDRLITYLDSRRCQWL